MLGIWPVTTKCQLSLERQTQLTMRVLKQSVGSSAPISTTRLHHREAQPGFNKHAFSTDSRPSDHHADGGAEVFVPAPGSARGLDGGGVGFRGGALLAHISSLLLVVAGERQMVRVRDNERGELERRTKASARS